MLMVERYCNQFITVMFREGEQHLLVALAFHTLVSHAHKPQLKMEESTTAEESDMTEKELTKKRLPTKVILSCHYSVDIVMHIRMYLHMHNYGRCKTIPFLPVGSTWSQLRVRLVW